MHSLRAPGEVMLTVTQLARRFQISRVTILYCELEGLLTQSHRSENGYRRYADKEIVRLKTYDENERMKNRRELIAAVCPA